MVRKRWESSEREWYLWDRAKIQTAVPIVNGYLFAQKVTETKFRNHFLY